MILVKIIIMVAIMAVIWRTTKAKEVHKVKTYYAYLLLHINFSLVVGHITAMMATMMMILTKIIR